MPWDETGTETPGAERTTLNAEVRLGCVEANTGGERGKRRGDCASREEEKQMVPFFTPAEMEGKAAGGKGPKPPAFRDAPG